MLSMQVRTLERRLEGAGTSFHDLLEGVRFEVSCQLLKDTTLAIGEISGILGYGGASSFSRAFRRWSGTTPARWRERQPLTG